MPSLAHNEASRYTTIYPSNKIVQLVLLLESLAGCLRVRDLISVCASTIPVLTRAGELMNNLTAVTRQGRQEGHNKEMG